MPSLVMPFCLQVVQVASAFKALYSTLTDLASTTHSFATLDGGVVPIPHHLHKHLMDQTAQVNG